MVKNLIGSLGKNVLLTIQATSLENLWSVLQTQSSTNSICLVWQRSMNIILIRQLEISLRSYDLSPSFERCCVLRDTRRGFRETVFCAMLTFCELTSINYRPAPVPATITEFPLGNDENIRIRHISQRRFNHELQRRISDCVILFNFVGAEKVVKLVVQSNFCFP